MASGGPIETVGLEACIGRVLAEDLRADRDGPPFDRVAMDGVALDSREAALGTFRVTAFQAAGARPLIRSTPGTAVEVATGAVLPMGCDAVVPYEALVRCGEQVTLDPGLAVKAGLNVHPKGKDFPRGALLLPAGILLRSPHAHLLAACGVGRVKVRAHAAWAIAATGDELVGIDQLPEAHQIRRSNSAAIRGEAFAWGLVPRAEVALPDVVETLAAGLRTLLAGLDFLVITGGVSRGAVDLVPEVLVGLGVRPIFHGVAQRPGKPIWFGRTDAGGLVFGLPGNPVAALIAFRRYVLPALLGWEGRPLEPGLVAVKGLAPLKGASSEFRPVIRGGDGFTPAPQGGSGDLRPLGCSDGFVQLDPGAELALPLPFYPWGLPGGMAMDQHLMDLEAGRRFSRSPLRPPG
jgi:molybdopterin molybdotransferase